MVKFDVPWTIDLLYKFSDDIIVDVYKTSDFRQSFVWRGLCFKTEEDLEKYQTVLREKRYQPLEEILSILEADMKKNGKMSESESIGSMGYADFGRKLQVIYSNSSLSICFTYKTLIHLESLQPISTERR